MGNSDSEQLVAGRSGRAPNVENRVPVGLRLDPLVFGVVSDLAVADDRSLSQMIERLLKTHPQVQDLLEAESATTAAPA